MCVCVCALLSLSLSLQVEDIDLSKNMLFLRMMPRIDYNKKRGPLRTVSEGEGRGGEGWWGALAAEEGRGGEGGGLEYACHAN